MNKHAALIDSLLNRQKEAWLAGKRPRVQELLQTSALRDDDDAVLDLLYNEVLVREGLGESPVLEEYCERFPHLEEALKIHFEIHRALQHTLLGDTPSPPGTLANIACAADDSWPHVGNYEILGELGRGGMGVVYKARHQELKRLVALKMFHPGRLPSARELARFRTEAEAVARLQHPNIVQIFEIGQAESLPFLALELAEGGTLLRRLQDAALTPRAAAELLETLARAVQHAHEHQIVHRDLKPGNLLFSADGTPKITDFGLAKVLAADPDAAHDATRTGEPIGTPRYMAPEQVAGRPEQIGPATDIYALGTMLYECLTGRAPFVAAGVMETMDQIRRDDPLPPRRLQPSIPRDLETICLTCLQKPIERRYPTALALAEDLRRFLDGEPIRARRAARTERLWKWCRRRPAQAALAAVLVVLVVAGAVIAGVVYQGEQGRLIEARNGVEALIVAGQDAAAKSDWRVAETRFQDAAFKIQIEPALHDLQTSVASLLEISARNAGQERRQEWRRRFGEHRDDAFIQGTVLAAIDVDKKEPLRAARASIRAALDLGDGDDASWQGERRQLLLLDADMCLRQGDASGALRLLDEVEPAAHGSHFYHSRRAEALSRLSRREDADREQAQAATIVPTESFDLFLSGSERLHRQDFAAAAAAFEKVLAPRPDDFAARYSLAACFLNLHRPAEAKVALTALIGQRPDIVWSYLLRGQALMQLGEHASAAKDFQHAARMGPQGQANFALHNSLGLLHLEQQRWSQARAELEQASQWQPDGYQAWVNLAHVYWRQKNWAAAEEHLARALKNLPGMALLHRTRALLRVDQGQWSQALTDLDEALRLDGRDGPEHRRDQVERARCLFRLDRPHDALRATQKALDRHDANADALVLQGEILIRLGKYREAIGALDRFLALGPATSDAYRARGFSHMRLAHYAEAIDDYSGALALHADADIFQHRGWAYFFADAFGLAEHDFEEALRRQPGVAEALLGRGLSRVYRGAYAAAVADADKAGKVATPDMEVNRACIYAQAALRLSADKGQARRGERAREYEQKALQALRDALGMVPASARAAFWSEKIATDAGLEPVRALPAFAELSRSLK